MTTVMTLFLALIIVGVLFFLFAHLKTPYYRVDRPKMVHTLEMVLAGQATENDWYMTFGMTIRHDLELEAYREECVAVEEECYIGSQKPPYLFSTEGLDQLRNILSELNSSS